MSLRDAIKDEMAWGYTENGADTLVTTKNACLDLFGRSGALRQCGISEKTELFAEAFSEDPDIAVKILFYARDIRGGYGERDTFTDMLRWLADHNTESVVKNLWAIMEFGRAKDLYSLIGTKAETEMWKFMKYQFELDYENMLAEKSISLLAKWIATPDSKSEATKELGKKTAKALGYTFKTMREYKDKLRAMRRYLDIPEVKMCAGKWDEIEYSKLGSQCLIKHRSAWVRHDEERYNEYLESVNNGTAKMNTGTLTPYDVIHSAVYNYTDDLETMWKSLEDVCTGNAMVMCDTSGSMEGTPIQVAVALSIYLAERNKGDLKDMFMTFNHNPQFMRIKGDTLQDKYRNIFRAPWGNNTNLEAAFDLLLRTCIRGNVTAEEMPDAILIISDMQIDGGWCGPAVSGLDSDNRMTFYDAMAKKYAEHGYKMPQVVFWNVNSTSPAFHASYDTKGVSLVSGFSTNIYKQVMESLGCTPYELMMKVIGSERYKDIIA